MRVSLFGLQGVSGCGEVPGRPLVSDKEDSPIIGPSTQLRSTSPGGEAASGTHLGTRDGGGVWRAPQPGVCLRSGPRSSSSLVRLVSRGKPPGEGRPRGRRRCGPCHPACVG